MTKEEIKRNEFLKYLASIYEQNPKFNVYPHTIYNELTSLNYSDEMVNDKIFPTNLVGVQLQLQNQFKNDKRATIVPHSYFWAVENRMEKNDKDFTKDIYNAIKLYIPIEDKDTYYVCTNVIDFMLKEKIIMQAKVSRKMRNDVFVVRVSTKEAALKVKDYVEKELRYNKSINPNPFLFQENNIGFALDGVLSYNTITSELLCEYFKWKMKTNSLKMVNCADFCSFVQSEISKLKGPNKEDTITKYCLSRVSEYKSFLMISSILLKNLSGSLSLESLFKYQEFEIDEDNQNLLNEHSKENKELMKKTITLMCNSEAIEIVHQRIMRYISEGNSNIFHREGGVRQIVQNNFPPEVFKEILIDIGFDYLKIAVYKTFYKYGYTQTEESIETILCYGRLDRLTNDNYARSNLAKIIPIELLKEALIYKAKEYGIEPNASSITSSLLKRNSEEKNHRMV